MKVMYCITQSNWGGAQAHVFELICDQIRRKNTVILVTGEDGELCKRLTNLKVKVVITESLNREVNVFSDLKAIYAIRKIIRKEKPNIVHLHSSKAGFIGRIAAIGLDVRVIYTVHGWVFNNPQISRIKNVLFSLSERLASPLTDKYLFVSKYDYNLAINRHYLKNSKRGKVVYNGVANPKFRKNTFLHNPARLLMVARFSNQKDQATLIQSVQSLKDCVVLTLVGNGPTLDKNEKLVNKLGLQDYVKFEGFHRNIDDYLKDSDIFILSTHYEGLPISIIEAMSFELPIIATNRNGNSELVVDGFNGFLTDGTVRDMELKIKKVLKNTKLLGENSKKLFLRKFQLDKVLNSVNDVYLQQVERGNLWKK